MVPEGLSEEDVSAFVEHLLGEQREAKNRLEYVDALHALATRTVEEAQKLSQEAGDTTEQIVSAANERARKIVAAAEDRASNMIKEAKTAAGREAASTAMLADKRAQELVLGAQASAERLRGEGNTGSEGIGRVANAAFARPGEDNHVPSQRRQLQYANDPATRADPIGGAAPPAKKPRPIFRWKSVPGATRYGLYVCGPPYGKDDFVFMQEDIADTSLTIPIDLEPGVTYQWTIRAGNTKGWGKPFPFRQYTT